MLSTKHFLCVHVAVLSLAKVGVGRKINAKYRTYSCEKLKKAVYLLTALKEYEAIV